jgi:integrase/recombinase XerD
MAQLLMSTLFERFLEDREVRKKPRTHKFYTDVCKVLTDTFGHVAANQLTNADINRLLKKHADKKDTTKNCYLRTLKAVLNYALENDYLKRTVRFKLIPIGVKKNVTTFTREQVEHLMSLADLRERTLILLLGATGMRIDEALHLKWGDIDEEQGRIIISSKPELGWTPKSHNEREVYIRQPVMNKLRMYRDKLIFKTDNDWVFQSRTATGKRLTTSYKRIRAIFKEAGLYKQGHLHHTLRKAAASFWITNNVDMKTIQKLLGHADVQTTAKYYTFTNEEAMRDAAKKSLV